MAVLGGVIASGHRAESPRTLQIVLAKGPIHNDILLPLTPRVQERFGFLQDHGVPVLHSQARWLVVGWGGRTFYTTVGHYSDVTPGAVLKSVTGDQSVLRFDVVGTVPATSAFQKLSVSDQELETLIESILADLDTGDAILAGAFTGTDVFLPAKPRFHIFRTCNVWVGRKLRQAGLRFGIWTPLPVSVTLSRKLYIAK